MARVPQPLNALGFLSSKVRFTTIQYGRTQPRKGLAHWCPGCKRPHTFWYDTGERGHHEWDGSVNAPTVTPSLRYYVIEGDDERTLCHYQLLGGYIFYLLDSAHDLRGCTVPLPDFPPLEAVPQLGHG